jgi:hypothetical protein
VTPTTVFALVNPSGLLPGTYSASIDYYYNPTCGFCENTNGSINITVTITLNVIAPCSGNPIGYITDVQDVIDQALGVAQPSTDVNGDGVVNVVDVQIMTNAVLGCGVNGSTPASFSIRNVAQPVRRKGKS